MNRYLLIIAVLGLLYFLWRRRGTSTITTGNEWNDYSPTKFRVIAGGGGGTSIVPVDDK